jgi:integrase/recombinase XerC
LPLVLFLLFCYLECAGILIKGMKLTTFRNYLQYEKRFSPHTVQAYLSDVGQWSDFLVKTFDIDDQLDVKHAHIRSWMVDLMENGTTPRSVNRKLSSLRSYNRFLRRSGLIDNNPFAKITGPRTGKRLPEVVGEKAMRTLLEDIDYQDGFAGSRDRLVIELLYMAGLRRSELIGLNCEDIDFARMTILVRGKGGKERLIPFSQTLGSRLKDYLAERKGMIIADEIQENALLLTDKARRTYPKYIYNKVTHYLGLITSSENRSPHVLRHTFATHLAEGGADINAIKELLGHSSLASTQVYTHTSIKRLKEAYDQAHPKA